MKEFNKKLVAVQAKLKAPKNQRNDFGKYNYRSAEDILQAAKPLLEEQELSLTISDEVLLIGSRFYVKATVTVSDGESSQSVSAFAREEDSKKGMDDAQITGAVSSYARKYALNGMFAIDNTADMDTMDNRDCGQSKVENPTIGVQREEARAKIASATNRQQLFAIRDEYPSLVEDKVFKGLLNARYGELA